MRVHRVLSISLAAILSATIGPEICSAATINIAPQGTAQFSAGINLFALNDQSGPTQTDANFNGNGREWSAITFGQLRSFDHLIIEQCPGFVVAGYEIQVSLTGLTNPNPDNDADWETVAGGSFSGQSSSSTPTRSIDFATAYNRAGVRLRTTDSSNIPLGAQRPREFWIFDNYGNIAPSATITAPGWTGTSAMVSERTTDQEYGNVNIPANQNVTFTWATSRVIDAVMIHGGGGAPSEHLIDFEIEYWDGSSWLDFVAPIIGNTFKTTYHTPVSSVSTTMLRLHITAADYGDGNARIGEVWIFPEPGSASLVLCAMGGAAMMRRRRVSTFAKA